VFRIRFHGRGGQGIKTASRILGTAFFTAGCQVQDAPRYGAERRGAPVFAYVRAARAPINERGVIPDPDLVAVADDSLIGIPAAGIFQGLTGRAVLLIVSHESAETWRHRLNLQGPVLVLPPVTGGDVGEPHAGAACAGAAAQLVGVITRHALVSAIREELAGMPAATLSANETQALAAFDAMRPHAGLVREGDEQPAKGYQQPAWVSLPFEEARISAPVIHGGLTSVEVRTGLWRTMRPVIDYDRCNHCWWVCSTFCPDSAIRVEGNRPVIDYDHCKGCMICVAKCPPHAIAAIPEHEAQREERAAAAT
jgi:pyruvate ferredoxin oxidoreductase gamma subunit